MSTGTVLENATATVPNCTWSFNHPSKLPLTLAYHSGGCSVSLIEAIKRCLLDFHAASCLGTMELCSGTAYIGWYQLRSHCWANVYRVSYSVSVIRAVLTCYDL